MSFEDESVQILAKLGFTSSQSKIYLSLVKHDQLTANIIAKITHTDRAETYRVLSALEKQGVIQRIVTNPVKFKATPLRDLVPILLQRKKSEISETEKAATKLLQFYGKDIFEENHQEEYFMLVPRTEMVLQKIKKEIVNNEKNMKVVSTLKRAWEATSIFKKEYLEALEKGVKITYIVEKPDKKNPLPGALKILSKHPNFSLRYSPKPTKVPIVLEDDKKVWIGSQGLDYLRASHLVTNNPHLIELAQEHFDLILQISIKEDQKPEQE